MKFSSVLSGAGLFAAAAAGGRPASESICDYYTTALLKHNTAANQATVLTLVVNTAVIGNYSGSGINVGVAVPGILTPGVYGGEHINLLPYFDGELASSNRGGHCGVAVNFLDGGGAVPLMHNKPANDETSNQYKYGNTVDPYSGYNGQYEVHKFMDLNPNQLGYFIMNVGLSAASFGVTDADVTAVGDALTAAFGYRCLPPASIPPFEDPEPQSICIDCSCPIAKDAECSAYEPVIAPKPAGKGSKRCGPGTVCPCK